MTGNVVHDLTSTGRVTDVNRIMQVEMRCQRSQVVGIMVHVVAIAGLRRAAVSTPVVRDHPVAVLQEEQHLGVPVIGRERPTMAEHDRLARAPILVEDLRAVGGRDRAHTCLR